MDSRNIFWGLVIKPGKRYETEVQEPFRVTKVNLSVMFCISELVKMKENKKVIGVII